ncbi:MAG: acyltransferase [Muribaculaceae bacterium]|nr:acyltransferase [Muribaculaceae bacterium]
MYYIEGIKYSALNILEKFIGGGICSTAVPLFYIISGFLFFLKVPNGMMSIMDKIRKRCRTLLVPYIIANILTFIFYVALNLVALRFSSVDHVVNFKVLDTVSQGGFWGTMALVFINPPIAFQLWFVRDLMVVVIFSPVIWIMLNVLSKNRVGRIVFLLIFLISLILGCHSGYFQALSWFVAGGFLAVMKFDIEKVVPNFLVLICSICYLVLCMAYAMSSLSEINSLFIPLTGIPTIWWGYDIIAVKIENSRLFNWLASYTFFIFLVHEPMLNIFKKIPLLISKSEPMLISCYLLIPPLFCFITAWAGSQLKQRSPKLYNIYTGGR